MCDYSILMPHISTCSTSRNCEISSDANDHQAVDGPSVCLWRLCGKISAQAHPIIKLCLSNESGSV